MGKDVILKTGPYSYECDPESHKCKTIYNQDLHDGMCLLVGGNEGPTEVGENISQH